MVPPALAFTESGPDDAPTVVLLHGGGAAGWTWRPAVERLPEFHCLVPDLPDHAGSISSAGPFSMSTAVDAVLDLIRRRAHCGRAHVAGLSLGAQTVVALLAHTPEVVDRALVSGALFHPLPGSRWLYGLLDLTVRAYMPFRNLNALVRANAWSYGIPSAYLEAFREDTCRLTADSFLRIMNANLSFRLPANLSAVPTPTLVLAGQREYGAMRRSARDLAAALPHGHGAIVQGARHNWPLEQPDLFVDVLRAWVRSAPLPARLIDLDPIRRA
jgi:pimeloyl-ACP methyl ester carboxylesterase